MSWKQNLGFYMSLVVMAWSAMIFWQSWELDYYSNLGPGPGLFPRWLSGSLLIVSILYMLGSIRRPIVWSMAMPKGKDLLHVLMVLVSVAIFILTLDLLGFIISGSLMVTLLLIRSYLWPRAVAIALSACLLIYFTFSEWLEVPLPGGQIWDWIG
ncbi:tripartite tricarboxylate transporter TctB family protein [Paenibacillus hamazuiensis]|uniref:tripartite tricarboxylate transporter TctB family protein n=1 Tax=Paenibacillus hamazuiensis TaxID=2936508 RepID=UPI00200ED083|nr:tripartite tricarboxylate transporter TctB family protein [Paenibacillus hamazuiensis]